MSAPWIVAFLVLWAVTLLVALLVLGLLRRVNSVLEAAEARVTSALTGPGAGGAPPGSKVAEFEAVRDGGRTVTSGELLAEPAVFVFMETGCAPCRELAGRLKGVDERLDGVPLYVVLEDTPGSREFPIPVGVPVLYQREGAVSRAFDTHATPQAFAVAPGGVVLENRIPGQLRDLRELAARCRASIDEAAERASDGEHALGHRAETRGGEA